MALCPDSAPKPFSQWSLIWCKKTNFILSNAFWLLLQESVKLVRNRYSPSVWVFSVESNFISLRNSMVNYVGKKHDSPLKNQLGSPLWNHFYHPVSHYIYCNGGVPICIVWLSGWWKWFSSGELTPFPSVEPFSLPRKSYYTLNGSTNMYSMTFWVVKMVLQWRTISVLQCDFLGGENGSTLGNGVSSFLQPSHMIL